MIKACKFLILMIAVLPAVALAQKIKVVTNQVGYEDTKAKKAIVVTDKPYPINAFALIDADGNTVFNGKAIYSGKVPGWKNREFYTLDFTFVTTAGSYQVQITLPGKKLSSYPFKIGKNVLEQATLSDVVYYFKGQRSAGEIDKADHHLLLSGKTTDTVDAHGGWYDATGDYGKHFSHLSFSNYFNPQQIPLVVWSLLKTKELLDKKTVTDFRQINRRVLDEATYGADYLARMQAKNGSFYRSVSAPGPGKLAKDRVIQPDEGSYRIKKTKDSPFSTNRENTNWHRYQSSYRSGGGMAIAALAMASTLNVSGDFTSAQYLQAAENAFKFLEENNKLMDFDGHENILDDYCALSAATELYKATKKQEYLASATKRANNLVGRLAAWKNYQNYWKADSADRPFFHPSDAGLPVVSLIYYYPYADNAMQISIKKAIKASFDFELKVTREVNNPFGYSRQLVQDTLGNRRTSFFFPQGSDASPWWQGENARLSSMAAAARLAAGLFADDKAYHDQLETFAVDQLNWILGLNPFDASMLQGTGHNNPAYGFFGTFEYTNAPGGIVNGVTGGLNDENDIDFNLSYAQIHKDYDWRWAEQWLPHTAWYLLAVALHE
ncbi:glycoside hydrolase family 9 protein [Mucilaginibacter sabulilitoris]|uniref:Glycoside hydrolase family 9 protein n=1 Tax=Mucilaginibacter sabulilitoris TaxID=1173583 RepID=A0ABZ0TLM7_9SPHI|nr:glycoside hydrolase family 9 protein [Mucilaginibacter sabulilitoris]WPU93063.1 glycoside hydrolase family 9 protein [Mucilaginibacter sabulilitoris]